jgi:hypothetical protein
MTSTLFGFGGKGYELSLQIERTEKVNEHLSQVANIHAFIERYIQETGDVTPTKQEIIDHIGLSSSNFQGYKNSIDFSIDSSNRIVYTDVMISNVPDLVLNHYKGSKKLHKIQGVIDPNTLNISIPLGAKTMAFANFIKKANLNSDIEVGINTPTNTLVTHYKPEGDGTVEVLRFNLATSIWESFGHIGSKQAIFESGKKSCLGTFLDADDLISVIGVDQGCAKVYQDNFLVTYEYVGSANKWVLDSTSAKVVKGLFNGDASILEMATTLLDSAGSSKAQASAIDGEFASSKQFEKRDNSIGGYWSTDDMLYIVSGSIEGITNQPWGEGTYGYIPNSDKTSILMLQKKNIPGVGVAFAYLAKGYKDVVDRFHDVKSSGSEGFYIYDQTNSTYFAINGDKLFVSKDGTVELSGNSDGRESFPSTQASTTYYTITNDCDEYNCNGDNNNYFSGVMKDNMYQFVYSEYGNRLNELIDGVYLNSMSETYSQAPNISVVGGVTYQKKEGKTDNGLEAGVFDAYLNLSDNKYYRSNGNVVKDTYVDYNNIVQLPHGRDLSNTAYFDANDIVILTSYDNLLKYINVLDSAQVYLNEATILDTFTYIDNGGEGFWTDNPNGDGQEYATKVLTSGSRSDLPNVTHSLTAVTVELGKESRYTTNGVAFSEDNSKYQWFYSSTGTTTNGLLDGVKAKDYYNDANAGEYPVLPDSGTRVADGKVWETREQYDNTNPTSNSAGGCRYGCTCTNGTLRFKKWGYGCTDPNNSDGHYNNSGDYKTCTGTGGFYTYDYLTEWRGGSVRVVWDWSRRSVRSCYKNVTDWY